MLLPYFRDSDTTQLNLINRFALKLDISDTSVMLSPYLRKTDTISLSNRINNKLSLADTASMLAPYLKLADTTSMLAPYFRDSDTTMLNLNARFNSKLNATDTVSLSNRINLKLNQTDTINLSNRIDLKLNKSDTISLSNRIDIKLNPSDTVSLSNRINTKLNSTDTISLSNRINLKLDTLYVNYQTNVDLLSNKDTINITTLDTISLSNRINKKFNTIDTAILGYVTTYSNQYNINGNKTFNNTVSVDSLNATKQAKIQSLTVGKGSSTIVGGISGGISSTAFGFESLKNNTIGDWNTAIGYQTLLNNTTAWANVAIGNNALKFNTSGEYNTAVGVDALDLNNVGNYNTAIGYNAGTGSRGSNNIFIGNSSGHTDSVNNVLIIGSAVAPLLTGILSGNKKLGVNKDPLTLTHTFEVNSPISNSVKITSNTNSTNLELANNSGSSVFIKSSNKNMILQTDTTALVYLNGDNKKVGILTMTPQQELEVAGNVRIDSLNNNLVPTNLVGSSNNNDLTNVHLGEGLSFSDDTLKVDLTIIDTAIAASSITLVGNVSGTGSTNSTVNTTINNGVVTNDMLAGSISDSKLNTITTSGKISNTAFASQTANTVLAAPNGSSGTPSFRLLASTDIPNLNYLPLTGGILTGGLSGTTGSFASSGGSNTFAINHSSGSGIALNITKGGNGEGLYINKTSGSGNAATIIGTLNATTLVKNGGTSIQFLKADGSVDNNTYLTTGTAASTYVPLNTESTMNATLNINGNLTLLTGGILTTPLLSAGTIIKQGGTTSQFLKANGDIDSTNYLSSSSAASTYLPLTGGTLTGALSGTTGTFTGLTVNNSNVNGEGILSLKSYNFNFANRIQFGDGSVVRREITQNAESNMLFRTFAVGGTQGGYSFYTRRNPNAEQLAFNIDLDGNSNFYGTLGVTSNITANSFMKSGGLSTQFLKANGDVDSNTYLTTSSAISTYLPLAGGTMTGAIRRQDDNYNNNPNTFYFNLFNYHARPNNNITNTPTAQITFTDRPGTSGFPTAVRTSDIYLMTAHNYNNIDYGIYLDTTLSIVANQDGGRIGISKLNPAYKLDVNGTFGVSGVTTLSNLGGGASTRMVVASTTGVLSTQAIPSGGSGTVTNVSVGSPANGLSVTNGTTTPVISMALADNGVTGVVSNNTQSFSGSKTFINSVDVNGFTTANGGLIVNANASTSTLTNLIGISAANGIGKITTGSGLSLVQGVLSVNNRITDINTSQYTILSTDFYIDNFNNSSTTIILPLAGLNTYRELKFKNSSTGAVIANGNIIPLSGSGTTTTILPATNAKWCTIVSDGFSWRIMQSN